MRTYSESQIQPFTIQADIQSIDADRSLADLLAAAGSEGGRKVGNLESLSP
jgi:hypothetical protein